MVARLPSVVVVYVGLRFVIVVGYGSRRLVWLPRCVEHAYGCYHTFVTFPVAGWTRYWLGFTPHYVTYVTAERADCRFGRFVV